MNEYYTFLGVSFVAVVGSDGETPYWVPQIESTDRSFIGTDRMERSIRTRFWVLSIDLWIEPAETARSAFETLQSAYALATVGTLTFPGDPAPPSVSVFLANADVKPVRGGIDGYRGKAVFVRPGGLT